MRSAGAGRQLRRALISAERLEPRTLLDASLLMDINTTTPGSGPGGFVDVNGVLLFTARTADGPGLFRSDGTPAGTTRIAPLTVNSLDPAGLFNGSIYFAASGSDGDVELWRSDGTAAGTSRVKDIYAGTSPSQPGAFRRLDGELYFVARDADHDLSFWKTDGTEAGTTFVYDPAPAGVIFNFGDIAAVGHTLYFSTSEGPAARLWRADGGFASVSPVRDFATDSVPDNFTAVGNRLVFSAVRAQFGNPGLWASDGTAAGTYAILEGSSDSAIRIPQDFHSTGSVAYFTAYNNVSGREVWKTDGTEAGTALVKDVNPGAPLGFGPDKLVLDATGLYFAADNGAGRGVYRSDGTEAGTKLLKQVDAVDIRSSVGAVYFSTRSSVTSLIQGLWKTDGSEPGTVLVRQFLPSGPGGLAPFKGGVAFVIDDGFHGAEPWFSDGTINGTFMLADLDARSNGSLPSAHSVAALGSRTLFTANPGGLWVTDGAASTTRVTAVPFAPGPMTVLDGVAYFTGDPRSGGLAPMRIWRSDGTSDGTRVAVPTFRSETGSLVRLGDALYTIGRLDDDTTSGLFRTDGTPQGTVRVADLPNGLNGLQSTLIAVGDALYYGIVTNLQAYSTSQLWRSDGTTAGTAKVKDFPRGDNGALLRRMTDAGGRLFFLMVDWMEGFPVLWTSDGTADGTLMLRQLRIPTSSTVPTLTAVGRSVFLGASGGLADDVELWKSDGTVDGTVLVKDIRPGPSGSAPQSLTAVDGKLYFSAADPVGGRELWASDGTEEGTVRVTDLRPGTGNADPTVWGEAGGRVYFSANDGISGRELWSTDGTAAGTTLVQDINPGAGSSNPLVPLPVQTPGGGLLFWADDGVHGLEPWTAPLPAPPPPFVVGRYAFYNNSRFDGRDPAINHGDDSAIAIDKQALLPGGTASFDNVTSYARGINGVMVDVNTRFAAFESLQFSFRVSSGGGWVAAPQPLEVATRHDRLPLDRARYEITWADGAIRNAWLEVSVEAVTAGVATTADVFYFGNLVGDAGSVGPTMRVDASDYSRTRARIRSTAAVDSPYDFNRDGRIDTLDLNIVRGSLFHLLQPPATVSERTLLSERRSVWIESLPAVLA